MCMQCPSPHFSLKWLTLPPFLMRGVSTPPFFMKVIDPSPFFMKEVDPPPFLKKVVDPPFYALPPLGVFLAASLICLDVQACKTFITMNTDLQNWSSAATTTKKIIHETSNILKKVTVTETQRL